MAIKRPVTLAQARAWPGAAKRRESFCARMGGMRDNLTGPDTARDPDSKINRALTAWDCDKPEGLKAKHVSRGIRKMNITKSMVGRESGRKINPKMSESQLKRVKQAIKETETALSRALRFSPENQDKNLIAFYKKHIEKLSKSLDSGNFPMDERFMKRKTNPTTKNNLPDYRKKSDEELRYIISDAGEAARAMKGHSPAAELKYLDQINDASTVLYERAAKFRGRKTNPTTKDAFLYIVHVCDANKKPVYDIAKFRKLSEAKAYAKAYVTSANKPVCVESKKL